MTGADVVAMARLRPNMTDMDGDVWTANALLAIHDAPPGTPVYLDGDPEKQVWTLEEADRTVLTDSDEMLAPTFVAQDFGVKKDERGVVVGTILNKIALKSFMLVKRDACTFRPKTSKVAAS